MNSLADNGLAIADYVVVGTGSAGSVLAERLSADLRNQVVVVEAGGRDTDRRIHMPVTWTQLFRSPIDWDYLTEPQAELNGREIYWPRGKTLGGSSSMSAMMWVRGFAADYDEWAEHAGPEWSFNQIVKYFKQIENVAGAREPDEGVDGPLHISHQRSPHPLTAAWLQAVQQTGHAIERPNLPQPNGFSQTMVTQRRGARWSAADAGYARRCGVETSRSSPTPPSPASSSRTSKRSEWSSTITGHASSCVRAARWWSVPGP
jgi:choline dehydrogenase-like flavoprotein